MASDGSLRRQLPFTRPHGIEYADIGLNLSRYRKTGVLSLVDPCSSAFWLLKRPKDGGFDVHCTGKQRGLNRPGPRLAGRRLWAIGRHAARFGDQINMDEVFGTHRRRPQRRPVAQGRAMSNGCTFAPPAIRGFDGSKCSCSSRFRTSARATTKASLRLLACRSATLKKASPK